MKNLRLIAVIFLALPAISFSARAQKSVKFIDGIELKSDAVAYAASNPTTEATALPVIHHAGSNATSLTTVKHAVGKMATEACNAIQFKYSQLMDVEIESISNISLFAFIDEWWNTAYRYGGTTKKGIDCSALTGLLLSTVYAVGVPRTAREQYAASDKIAREDMQEGDLVFFNTKGGISHVGVYLNNDRFVHASTSSGVTISSLNDDYYSKRFIGAGRPIVKGTQL
ncbi:MAG: NlpC/P60 family protein [Chitinophagaceae bacterium]|nr:MAG: NlpC/P60 family protein [Chitinophagaceae bacterium]